MVPPALVFAALVALGLAQSLVAHLATAVCATAGSFLCAGDCCLWMTTIAGHERSPDRPS